MGTKSNATQETPQQAAMVQKAQEQLADYKQRWLPLQQNMARQIEGLSNPDSPVRLRAEGRATTETAARFQQARGSVDSALTNAGVSPNSSRFKLANTNMANDEATSKGMGMLASDQAIDQAYTQGLGALTTIGRGEKATALQGASDVAAMSGRQAAADANISLQQQESNAMLGGQVVGMGLSRLGQPSSAPVGNTINPVSGGSAGYYGPNNGYIVPDFGSKP